ncbi:MAG TPA: hypothetical protein VLU25_07720 [Acidobacteriota bacterium]|nr:hypothetical protein [Acidobacteriota bacterium]
MKRLPLAAAFFTVALALAESPDPKAAKVEKTLNQIQEDQYSENGSGNSYMIQEDELNAYLKALIEVQQPEGLDSARVRLDGSRRFTTWLEVDLDQLDLEKSGAGWLSYILTGKRTMQVEGRLETSQGRGSYTVIEAWMGSVPIPASLVNSAIKQVGEKQDPPFDPTKSFDLPYGLRDIEVMKGQAVLSN